MRIACLGWGSLIWNRDGLPILGGDDGWHHDGPYLPVEFARQSSCDRLTLVLLPDGAAIQTLWAEMTDGDLAAARLQLARREKTKGVNPIGVWPSHKPYAHAGAIGEWAVVKGFDGVVWTALGPKFDEENGKLPTSDEAVAYLRALIEVGESSKAEEYIRKAPAQVRTSYRIAFEKSFGWTPIW